MYGRQLAWSKIFGTWSFFIAMSYFQMLKCYWNGHQHNGCSFQKCLHKNIAITSHYDSTITDQPRSIMALSHKMLDVEIFLQGSLSFFKNVFITKWHITAFIDFQIEKNRFGWDVLIHVWFHIIFVPSLGGHILTSLDSGCEPWALHYQIQMVFALLSWVWLEHPCVTAVNSLQFTKTFLEQYRNYVLWTRCAELNLYCWQLQLWLVYF